MADRKSKFLESTLCTPLTVPDAPCSATDSATASEAAKEQKSANLGPSQPDTKTPRSGGERE